MAATLVRSLMRSAMAFEQHRLSKMNRAEAERMSFVMMALDVVG
jgi:hypothetical protein